MKAAFHFDADQHGGSYGPPIQKLLFDRLMKVPRGRRHLVIYLGDLVAYDYVRGAGGPSELFALLVRNAWSTLDPSVMTDALEHRRIYVLLVEGLMRQDAEAVDSELRRSESYLGALDVNPGPAPSLRRTDRIAVV